MTNDQIILAEKAITTVGVLLSQFLLITLPLIRIGNRLSKVETDITQIAILVKSVLWPKHKAHS